MCSTEIAIAAAPWLGINSHISGSFFMSTIAATGIPKLETGPQKSVYMRRKRFMSAFVLSGNRSFGDDGLEKLSTTTTNFGFMIEGLLVGDVRVEQT